MRYPALHGAADAVSAQSQRRFLLALGVELTALGAGALLGLLSASKYDGAGPIAAVVLFAVALLVRVSRTGERAQHQWYDARAAAESIKSGAWQYAVGGEAYRTDDPTATARFEGDLERYFQQLSHLDVPADAAAEAGVTAEMEALRAQPVPERAAAYLRDRIDDQLSWYAANATKNKRLARRWSILTAAVEAAALARGVERVLEESDHGWLGVLGAVAAAMAAWAQAKRYTELSESYSVTSHEVGIIKASIDPQASEPEWARFVHDAEAAFSREHTLWLARRQGPIVS